MGVVVDEIVTRVRYGVDKGSEAKAKSSLGGIKAAAKTVVGDLTKVGAAITAAFTVSSGAVIKTGAEFEMLRARLKTVTGSAANAAQAFGFIKQFAKDTPFEVQNLTTAFIRLKGAGIDPTAERMRSFGNTAASMGKDILDFTEAVTDAQVGEFERLKDFNIKAQTQGEQVAFTFQGQTTTVKKEAGAIVKYLESIGNTAFAGAMAEQMNTATGKVSNLKDAMSSFFDEVAQSGPLEEFKGLVEDVTGQIGGKGSESLAKALGRTIQDALRKLREVFAQIKRERFDETLKSIASAGAGLIKGISEAVRLFFKFADSVGGVETAVKTLTPAIVAMRVATTGAAGGWGTLVAAMVASIPIAIEVGNRIGEINARIAELRGGGYKTPESGVRGVVQLDAQGKSELADIDKEIEAVKAGKGGREVSGFAAGLAGGVGVSQKDLSDTQRVKRLEALERRRDQAIKDSRARNQARLDATNTAKDTMNARWAEIEGQRIGGIGQEEMKAFGRKQKMAEFRKLRGKKNLSPSERKRLQALSKELDIGTSKGSTKKPEQSGFEQKLQAEIDRQVTEAEEDAGRRALLSGSGLKEATRIAKRAGEKTRAALRRQLSRGESILQPDLQAMLRQAGLTEESRNVTPPIITITINKVDVHQDIKAPISVSGSFAEGPRDVASRTRQSVRAAMREEIVPAITEVLPKASR